MKSYTVVPLLAATALAQSQADGPNCGIITNPPLDNDYPAGARPIAVALVNINQTTVALNQSIDAFDGSNTAIINLQQAASNVLANIQSGNANVSAIPALDDSDDGQLASFALVTYVGGLACSVNATADNLINSKQALVNACVGPIVLQNARQQQADSLTFEATVKSKISPSLQDTSDTFVAPINVALSSAVAAFADQTTLPASCSSTTTTASTTTSAGNGVDATLTGTTSATATASGTLVGPGVIGGNGNGWAAITSGVVGGTVGGSAWSAIGQPAPTGAAGSNGVSGWSTVSSSSGSAVYVEEDCDCDDDEQPGTPYSSNGDAEEECDDEETDSPTSSTGDAEYECYDDEDPSSSTWQAWTLPTGAATATYGASGPALTSSSGWQAVYSGKPTIANGTAILKYTGAAVANTAGYMGVSVAALMAAFAMF